MHIEKTPDFRAWVGETLQEMAHFQYVEERCGKCGMAYRYPIIARQRDIEDFEMLMRSAYKIMDKYGITANLLAEIKATCFIEIAKRISDDKE